MEQGRGEKEREENNMKQGREHQPWIKVQLLRINFN